MATIKDVLAYYCKEYPHKMELGYRRLTMMVYLADWKFAIEYRKQITDIQWGYNYSGPYMGDVMRVIQTDPVFKIEPIVNLLGGHKEVVCLNNDDYIPSMLDNEKSVLDHVIKITKDRYWDSFLSLVYSTYPILKSEKYQDLDLVKLAYEYKREDMEEDRHDNRQSWIRRILAALRRKQDG